MNIRGLCIVVLLQLADTTVAVLGWRKSDISASSIDGQQRLWRGPAAGRPEKGG